MRNIFYSAFFSDSTVKMHVYSSILFGLSLWLTGGAVCRAEQVWNNRSVLIAEDVYLVQLSVDALHVAKVLSTFSFDDYLHRHLQPLLSIHTGWERVRGEVIEALEDLEDAIKPRRITRVARPRPKRSFLGMATTGDL